MTAVDRCNADRSAGEHLSAAVPGRSGRRSLLCIGKLRRRLRILNGVFASVMRAADESTLLQSMCEMIAAKSGHPLAWVCLCDAEDAQSGRLASWAGSHAFGFHSGGDGPPPDPWGSGLVGPVGTYRCRCERLTVAHQALEPWRSEALRRGYGMAAVLPLIDRKRLLGSLVVLSARVDAFDNDERALLREVADRLSFAIGALRDHAAQMVRMRKLRENLDATVVSILTMLGQHDPYTVGHQRRVADLAAAIAQQMGLEGEVIHGIRLASLLHDIGKIGIPAMLLNWPEKLSPAAFELIKGHCQAGFDIVKHIDFPWPIAQIILQHHERLDGSGYPAGLMAEQILVEARIVAVADVVDAISASRPYRPALGINAATAELAKGRGRHYDPAVVDACLELVGITVPGI